MAPGGVARDELLARIDLVALADELLGPHKGSDRSPMWSCPAPGHGPQTGKSPPLSVFTSHVGIPRYRCHGCGEGGTAIDLVMAAQGLSVGQAMRWLADRCDPGLVASPTRGVRSAVRFRSPSGPAVVGSRPAGATAPGPSGRESTAAYVAACERLLWRREGDGVRQWLERRGLDPDILRANRVGADPGPRVLRRPPGLPRGGLAAVFPVLDAERSPLYLQARYLDPGGVGRRYDNPAGHLAGTNPKVAVVHLAGEARHGGVLVCEGVPDALTAAQHGLRSVAVLGVGMADDDLAHRLAAAFPGERLVVAFDRDANGAGQRGARHLAELFDVAGAHVGMLPVPSPHNDLNDWAVASGRAFEAELADAWTRVVPLRAPLEPAPTPAEVRAAAHVVVDWYGRSVGIVADPPAEALAVLRRAPALPGRFGAALEEILTREPPQWAEPVRRLAESLGQVDRCPPGTDLGHAGVAGLAGARDAALDRALAAALRPGGHDPAEAQAWAEIHDRAVVRLASDSAGGAGHRPSPSGMQPIPTALRSEGAGMGWSR